MTQFPTPLDLLEGASAQLRDRYIDAVSAVDLMYRQHITDRPGLIHQLSGSSTYDDAIVGMDNVGWLNEDGQLFIPDRVYHRVQRELPADFTAWLETHRPKDLAPNDEVEDLDQHTILGYYCSLYCWCLRRGMID